MRRGHRSRGGTNKHFIQVGPLPGIEVSSLLLCPVLRKGGHTYPFKIEVYRKSVVIGDKLLRFVDLLQLLFLIIHMYVIGV